MSLRVVWSLLSRFTWLSRRFQQLTGESTFWSFLPRTQNRGENWTGLDLKWTKWFCLRYSTAINAQNYGVWICWGTGGKRKARKWLLHVQKITPSTTWLHSHQATASYSMQNALILFFGTQDFVHKSQRPRESDGSGVWQYVPPAIVTWPQEKDFKHPVH